MDRGRVLLAVSVSAAVLGGLALITGASGLAGLAGLSAIAAASLAVRGRTSDPDLRRGPPVQVVVAAPPEPLVVPPADADGVLSERFLEVALEQRVAIARRALRPVSIVLLEVCDADPTVPDPALDQLLAATVSTTLRESDVVGRRSDGVYVFVLEDTTEDGAVWTAERMRRALALATGDRWFRAGIASYPSHGLEVRALVDKAGAALDAAREWKRDRIEVASLA